MSRADPRLGPSDFVILGILAAAGPATPYALKQAIGSSVGFFWPFVHAQTYAETKRLAELGLAQETREELGRRRRLYAITPAGRVALNGWLETPTPEPAQFRDLGLLKLAFGGLASPDALVALASQQAAAHADRLRVYEGFSQVPMDRYLRATLELGLRYERAALDFWESINLAQPDS